MDKPTAAELMARQLYTTYTEAVGGVNFRGEPLPNADEFFTDETKKKQADAWRKVANTHYPYTVIKDHIEGMTDLPWYVAMEAMKDGWGIKAPDWDVCMRLHYDGKNYDTYFACLGDPGKTVWSMHAYFPADVAYWEIVGPQLDIEEPVKSISDTGWINDDPTVSEADSAPYSGANEEE